MVVSVFAGTLAFAGTASAAVSGITVADATDVSEDEPLTKQKVALSVDTSGTDNNNLTVSVADVGGATVTDATATGFSADGVVVDQDANTVTFTNVNDSGAAGDSDYITLTYDTTDVTDVTGATLEVAGEADNYSDTANFDLVDENAVDAFADGGNTVWAGQNLYFEGSGNTVYEVHQVSGDNNDQVGTLVTQFNTGNDGVYVFNSETFETGEDYVVTNANGEVVELNNLGVSQGVSSADNPVNAESWGVTEQTLSAEWDDQEVTNEDAPSATTYAEIDSNRATYDVTVSANGLDVEELEDIFAASENDGGNFADQNVIATDDDDNTITVAVGGDTDLYGDFTDIDADDYQFSFEGADTSASSTANISVIEDEGGLSLDQGTVSEERGDVAEFTVNMDNTDDGYVQVGSDDVGYNVTLAVEDGGDGQVEVQMNTYEAGSNGTWADGGDGDEYGIEDEQPVYTLTEDSEDDDDTVEVVGVHSDALENPLEAGTYDIAVAADSSEAASDGENYIENEDDLGTLDLQERGTEGVQLWTASGNANFDDREELLQVVNQTDQIAGGSGESVADFAVVQLQASGIYGQIEEDNLNTLNQPGLSLTVEEANPGANQDAEELDLTQSGNVEAFYTDEENNTAFLVVDTADEFFQSDEDYTAQWELTVDNPMITDDADVDDDEEEESASADFSVVEPTVEFNNVNNNDELEIAASENAEVSGTTNIAAGSEVTIRVRSDESGQAFLQTADATVGENGSFSATMDLSDVQSDTEFTAELRRSGQVIGDDVDGVVVESTQTETPETGTPGETTTPGETAAPGETTTPGETAAPGETTTSTTTSPADGGTTTATGTTTQDTPGFGIIVALVALVAAALLAVRRDN